MQLSLTWLPWEVVVATRRVTNRWEYTGGPWQTLDISFRPLEEVAAPSANPPIEATCIVVMLGPLTLSQLLIRSKLRVLWASSLISSTACQIRARKATTRTQMTSSYHPLTIESALRLLPIIRTTAQAWWTCMTMLQMCSQTKSRH